MGEHLRSAHRHLESRAAAPRCAQCRCGRSCSRLHLRGRRCCRRTQQARQRRGVLRDGQWSLLPPMPVITSVRDPSGGLDLNRDDNPARFDYFVRASGDDGGRYCANAAALNGKLYIIGGCVSRNTGLYSTLIFDPHLGLEAHSKQLCSRQCG